MIGHYALDMAIAVKKSMPQSKLIYGEMEAVCRVLGIDMRAPDGILSDPNDAIVNALPEGTRNRLLDMVNRYEDAKYLLHQMEKEVFDISAMSDALTIAKRIRLRSLSGSCDISVRRSIDGFSGCIEYVETRGGDAERMEYAGVSDLRQKLDDLVIAQAARVGTANEVKIDGVSVGSMIVLHDFDTLYLTGPDLRLVNPLHFEVLIDLGKCTIRFHACNQVGKHPVKGESELVVTEIRFSQKTYRRVPVDA